MRSTRLRSAETPRGKSSSGSTETATRPSFESTTMDWASRRKSPTIFFKCSRRRSRREWASDFCSLEKSLGGIQVESDGGPCGRRARAFSSSYRSMDPKQIPAKRRVHIVDDESEVREALSLLLSTAGIETATHEAAEAYLEAVPLAEPACVILDNRLPGLSGLELLRRIADSGGQAAVIMMTGHSDVPTAVAAMKLGAFHFAEKPFDAEAMLSAVEEALSRAEAGQDFRAGALAFRSRRELLTQREDEVFNLLVEGLPTKVIAARLDITARTAEHHRAAVMRKLEARSISHLMRMALNVKK